MIELSEEDQAFYEERAAMIQYEGNTTKAEAEKAAYRETIQRILRRAEKQPE